MEARRRPRRATVRFVDEEDGQQSTHPSSRSIGGGKVRSENGQQPSVTNSTATGPNKALKQEPSITNKKAASPYTALKQDSNHKKKKAIGGADVLEEFCTDVLVDDERDVCALCKKGYVMGLFLHKSSKRLPQWRCESDEEEENSSVESDDVDDLEVYSKELEESSDKKKEKVKEILPPRKKKYVDPEFVWVSRYSLTKNRMFVHFYCALFSPMVSFDGERYYNVKVKVMY